MGSPGGGALVAGDATVQVEMVKEGESRETEALVCPQDGEEGALSQAGLQIARLSRLRRLAHLTMAGLAALACALGATAWLALGGRAGPLRCEWAPEAPAAAAPRVLLVSFDGFRFDYIQRAQISAPNLRRLIDEGTHAEHMVPVYPSKTFPNHYSLATGLYPTSHGIIANSFCYRDWVPCFSMSNKEPRYWLGEPIWQTAALQGRRATTYFWPGSEVPRPGWPCDPEVCAPYDGATPYEDRVDAALRKYDGDPETWPALGTLYFEETDSVGHAWGTDCPEMTAAVERLDGVVGRLLAGLEARGALDALHLVVVGDHGMVSLCSKREIDLAALAPSLDPSWVKSLSPQLGIEPPEAERGRVLAELRAAVAAAGAQMEVYAREDLPARLRYSTGVAADRVWPIYGFPHEGYRIVMGGAGGGDGCGGNHGYDNALQSMGTVFIGRGPRFHRGRTVPAFESVEVYGVLAEIIGVEPAPNNGTPGFVAGLLRPRGG